MKDITGVFKKSWYRFFMKTAMIFVLSPFVMMITHNFTSAWASQTIFLIFISLASGYFIACLLWSEIYEAGILKGDCLVVVELHNKIIEEKHVRWYLSSKFPGSIELRKEVVDVHGPDSSYDVNENEENEGDEETKDEEEKSEN